MRKIFKSLLARKPKAIRDARKRDDRFGIYRNLHPTKAWRFGEPRGKNCVGLQLNNGDYIDLRAERKATRNAA